MDMTNLTRVKFLVVGSMLVLFTAGISLCKGVDEGFSATPGQREAPKRR